MNTKITILLAVAILMLHQAIADYIWHNGEIPFEANAKCFRGHSYYSNDPHANDTDIHVPDDIESILDYPNKTVCYYCVCSVSGHDVGCIERNSWYCEYFRIIRHKDAVRDSYRVLFKQDRPAYFSHISWRLRRKMDEGIYELIDTVGTDLATSRCVPFVSEYSDCTEENQCSGCTRCSCSAEGQWSCARVADCTENVYSLPVDDSTLDNALNVLYSELKNKEKVPAKYDAKSNEDVLLDKDDDTEQRILALMTRQKRSIENKPKENTKNNDTVKFYHTVDEINEDTLQNMTETGTIQAKKIDIATLPKISRRTSILNNRNASSKNPLHIEYNNIPEDDSIDHHNKIDATTHIDEDDKVLSPQLILTNYTEKEKDKDLSKLIVNELKVGTTETIGGRNAPVMSNITFTPENDTLTAMAFIAGNLLNKLWSMEKAKSDESMEIEDLKHQKISDLIELFKEPLTMRQENFLKNALQKLSDAMDDNKDPKNISLCENIIEAKRILKEVSNLPWERTQVVNPRPEVSSLDSNRKKAKENKNNATVEAINKINNVLELIKKFETVHENLNDMKKLSRTKPRNELEQTSDQASKTENLTNNETESLNLYGNILEKITRLLLPNKTNKKLMKKIRNQHVFDNTENFKKTIKESYDIDLGNMTLSAKDKLVLDYLTKIKRNPGILNEDLYPENVKSGPNIEGDILLNLSEFFKIKSFVDLIKLMVPEKTDKVTPKPDDRPNIDILATIETTLAPDTTTNTHFTKDNLDAERSIAKLSNTKEKLKAHLKSILDDLIELQKEKGISTKEGKIRIADALPCIYNIINAGEEVENKLLGDKPGTSSVEKITEVFEALKEAASQTRRTTTDTKPKPKSAVVWERIIKSLDENEKQKSRRNLEVRATKPFVELKMMMDKTQSPNSNAYKNYAIFAEVPPAEQLMLLKTLEADIKQYVNVLGNLKLSIDTLEDKNNEIKDFVENATANISLMDKVFQNVDKPKHNKTKKENKNIKMNILKTKPRKITSVRKQDLKMPISIDRNRKLSRDEILIQLIKNRVSHYLNLKDAEDIDLGYDPSYNIAKNIITNLENGNYRLAKELYKVFVSTKSSGQGNKAPVSPKTNTQKRQYNNVLNKEPLIQFEDPESTNKQMESAIRDQMVKQLLNIKNMRV